MVNFLNQEERVPMQIKSSETGLKKHIGTRRKKKGEFVVVVVIRPYYTDQEIFQKIKEALDFYFAGKARFARLKKRLAKKAQKAQKS